jgi:hypothetical protein
MPRPRGFAKRGLVADGCSAQLKLRYGNEAKQLVARQLEWARERSNGQEIAYWSAVLEDLASLPS